MKQFSDLGVKPIQRGFVGDKISINRIIDRKITVYDFDIKDSKFEKKKGNGKCLYMQIEIGENKHVVFTGAIGLMDTIGQVPKSDLPFITTITKDNDRLIFT